MPKIIKTMELLGYSPNKGGLCFGIAMMGSQAIVRNQSQHFIDRIEFIQNASEEQIESLAEPFDRTIPKDRQEKKLDLCCFFDELSVYQSNESVNEAFISVVPTKQSVNNVKNLANADSNADLDSQCIYPQIGQNVINLFTYNEFINFLLTVQKHLGEHSFSIVVWHSPKLHATQIGFDAKQQQWFSSDHDYVQAGKNNLSDIKKVVNNIFIPHQYNYDGINKLAVSLDILLSKKNATDTEINLHALQSRSFNPKHITTSFNRKALSHLILCYENASRYDEMISLFDKIKSLKLPEKENRRLLEPKRANGFTLLHFLTESDEANALRAIFIKAQEMALSTKARIRMLAAKDENHPSLLLLALRFQSEKVVSVLTDAISAIEDEHEQARLLGEKWSGIPALSIATEKGYHETVRALIEAISGIKDNHIKASLLEAKDDYHIPALLLATEKECIKTVETLIKAICNIEDERLKAQLLEAKDDEDISALFTAVDKRSIGITEMLINAICSIEDSELRTALLEAKDGEETSPLLIAVDNGCKTTVEMLIKAINGIDDKQARVRLLEAKRSDGISAPLMASSNGHDDILDMLIDAIYASQEAII